jgi:hypothetical protein
MKFAPIVPINYLNAIKDRDYHLVLPHLLEEFDYRDAYRAAEGFKILDNGEAEGMRMLPDQLFRYAEMIGATEIVIPDVLRDSDATITMMDEFAAIAKTHPEYEYMAVVQGSTMPDIMKCVNAFMQNADWISRLAFPRAWFDFHRGLRTSMAESLHEPILQAFHGIHCLGANSFVREPVMLSSIPDPNPIHGIDTSLPAYAAAAGLEINRLKPLTTLTRPDNFFYMEYDVNMDILIHHNIKLYDGWCNNY